MVYLPYQPVIAGFFPSACINYGSLIIQCWLRALGRCLWNLFLVSRNFRPAVPHQPQFSILVLLETLKKKEDRRFKPVWYIVYFLFILDIYLFDNIYIYIRYEYYTYIYIYIHIYNKAQTCWRHLHGEDDRGWHPPVKSWMPRLPRDTFDHQRSET